MTSLAAVRSRLEQSGSEQATYLTSLIDNANIGSFETNPESKVRQQFGPLRADFPRLGKKLSPFDAGKLPSTQELQELCLRDLEATREYFGDRLVYFAPSCAAQNATGTNEEDSSLNVVHDHNDDSEAICHAITFQSESLQDMCGKGSEQLDNVLHTSMIACIVIPRNTLLPLQHSNEGITTTTLLSGSIIWIIWPPTDYNLNILQSKYKRVAKDLDDTKLDEARDLESGITFIQNEGEALCVPPFCLMMNLSTKTSVLATSSTVTADTYITMLRRLPLLKAWFKTEVDGERKQSEFNSAMLKALDRMLNGEIDLETGELDETHKLTYAEDGALHTLLSTWDHVKNDVAAIIGSTDAKVMEAIWSSFLIESKGRECKMCGKVIRNKIRLMRKHFLDLHWPMEKVAGRVDSMEVIDVSSSDGNEDAMEPM
ncbi:Nn.00g091640.m01.CDS01 [Neocucurbitaria sp. VM-36]